MAATRHSAVLAPDSVFDDAHEASGEAQRPHDPSAVVPETFKVRAVLVGKATDVGVHDGFESDLRCEGGKGDGEKTVITDCGEGPWEAFVVVAAEEA